MTPYDKLAAVDAEVRAGRTNLLELMDYMQANRLSLPFTVYSRAQVEAALKDSAAAPAPEPEEEPVASEVKPESIRGRRQLR